MAFSTADVDKECRVRVVFGAFDEAIFDRVGIQARDHSLAPASHVNVEGRTKPGVGFKMVEKWDAECEVERLVQRRVTVYHKLHLLVEIKKRN